MFKFIDPFDKNQRIKGVYYNTKENISSFVKLDDPSDPYEGIFIQDLALCLYVYCNDAFKDNKSISFSLDPADEFNPDGDFQRKVTWPDESLGQKIIGDTEFSEIMFKADWLMK